MRTTLSRHCLLAASILTALAPMEAPAQFVEPNVRVLYKVSGEADNDNFGLELLAVADYDGDGVREFVVCAPGNATGGPGAGNAYLLDGATGSVLREHPGSRVGESRRNVNDAGDVDNDGIVDYLVGTGDGWVYVYSGADGSELLAIEGAAGEIFGFRSAAIGDIDGDDHDDLLIGAFGNRTLGIGAGAAYVHSGADGSRLRTHFGAVPGGRFGHTVATIGDVDNDGVPDYNVGAPGPEVGINPTGQVFVYSGATGAELPYSPLDPLAGAQIYGGWVNSLGGIDFDGNGTLDFTVTDLNHPALRQGILYVYDGTTGALVNTFFGASAASGFGGITASPPSSLGDVTGDGLADMLIGSWESDVGAPNAGQIEILRGTDGVRLRSITSTVAQGNFGGAAAALGDIDGDGFIDFAVGANVEDNARGNVYVIAGIDHTCPFSASPVASSPDPRNRYLTITPANAGRSTALRVTMDSLHHPNPPTPDSPDFASSEGEARWVGPPVEYPEGVAETPSFYAAQLQCEPHFTDWSAFGSVAVFGDAIVPSSAYSVQAVDVLCAGAIDSAASYSAVLTMTTSRWGDVAAPFNPPSAFSQPDVNDILLIVDKFLGAFPPLKVSAQLFGNTVDPSEKPDIDDILLCVDAFLGRPYPYAGPSACP